MLKKSLACLAFACSATLGFAAAEAGTVSRVTYHNFYEPSQVRYMAKDGRVNVVVVGAPFPDAAVVRQLSLPGYYPNARMVEAPATDRKGPYLVFAFDVGGSTDGTDACQAPQQIPQRQSGSQMTVQGAFCFGNEVVSEALLTTSRPRRADEPAFRQDLAQLMEDLLTNQDPRQREGTCSSGIC